MKVVADGHRRDCHGLTILVGRGVRGHDHGMARSWTILNRPERHVNVVAAFAGSIDAGYAMTIVRL
jgi:hypothetical protein